MNYFPIIQETKLYILGRLKYLIDRIKTLEILIDLAGPNSIFIYLEEKEIIQKEIREIKRKLQEYYLI